MLRQFDEYVEAHVDTALHLTTQLKKMLSSPVADIVTAIIPGNLDDVLKKQLIAALGIAIEALSIADTCKLCEGINDKLKCFMRQLQLRDPQLQDAILQKLAGLITNHLDGQRFNQRLYDLFTQAKFTISK